MGHVKKKLDEQPWYSLLWYGSVKIESLRTKNLRLLMKIGDNNIEDCRKQKLSCILCSDVTIHNEVIIALGNPNDSKINDRSLVWDAKDFERLPPTIVDDLTKKRVVIIPKQYTLTGKEKILMIFPKKGSAMAEFRGISLKAPL